MPISSYVAWGAILKKTTINKTYWEWKLYYLSDNGRQSRLGNCRPSTPCSLSFRLPPRLGYSNCVTGGRVKFDRWPSVGVLRILITFGHTTLNSDLPGWQTIQQKRNLTFQEIIKRKRKKKGRPSTRKQNIDLIRSLISREGSEKTILVTNRSYKKKIWAKYGKKTNIQHFLNGKEIWSVAPQGYTKESQRGIIQRHSINQKTWLASLDTLKRTKRRQSISNH